MPHLADAHLLLPLRLLRLQDAFGGERGPVADALNLNAGVALNACKVAATPLEGVAMAREAQVSVGCGVYLSRWWVVGHDAVGLREGQARRAGKGAAGAVGGQLGFRAGWGMCVRDGARLVVVAMLKAQRAWVIGWLAASSQPSHVLQSPGAHARARRGLLP